LPFGLCFSQNEVINGLSRVFVSTFPFQRMIPFYNRHHAMRRLNYHFIAQPCVDFSSMYVLLVCACENYPMFHRFNSFAWRHQAP